MKTLVLLLFFSLSLTAQEKTIQTIFTEIKSELASASDKEKTANSGLKKFEDFILSTKEISEKDLSMWFSIYRGLENFAFKKTERSDGFIENIISTKKISTERITLLSRIKKETVAAEAAEKAATENLSMGKRFPELPDNTLDVNDKPVKIHDFDDKVVLIDFWATWCPPCVEEIPNVKKAYKKYKSKGFEIIGISLDREASKLTDFIKTEELKWFNVLDKKSTLGQIYQIRAVPTTYLLKNGVIVAKNLRGNQLEEALKKHLGE